MSGWVRACEHCGSSLTHYAAEKRLERTVQVRCCGCGSRGPEVAGKLLEAGVKDRALMKWNETIRGGESGRYEARTLGIKRKMLIALDRAGVLNVLDFPEIMTEAGPETIIPIERRR